MQPDVSQQVAARLGLDDPTIRRLAANGYLQRLALTEPQIRIRLYHAHLAYLRMRADGWIWKEES